jgi:hypothetical protein
MLMRDFLRPRALKQNLLAELQLPPHVADIVHQETQDEISIDWRHRPRRGCFCKFC